MTNSSVFITLRRNELRAEPIDSQMIVSSRLKEC